MVELVNAPGTRTPYKYGLLTTPVGVEVIDHPNPLRVSTPYAFETVACAGGQMWSADACAPSFTVTFTRTATVDQFTVTSSTGSIAGLEVSINGGGFAALTSPLVIAAAPPVTVTIRETAGIGRSVTRTDINPDAATGTVFGFGFAQTANEPKAPGEEGVPTAEGFPFMAIASVSCTPIGQPDMSARAREALQSAEPILVEQAFWAQLAASTPDLPEGATPHSLEAAVGILEEYSRARSGYTPVLHTRSRMGAYLSHAVLVGLHQDTGGRRTALDTPVVFGGGYDATGPAGQPAATATQAWIYVTGPVVVHRGPIKTPGAPHGGFDVSTNQELAVAERSYVIIPDCPVAAVLADKTVV